MKNHKTVLKKIIEQVRFGDFELMQHRLLAQDVVILPSQYVYEVLDHKILQE
jgi:hypothetical protein